ncbi:MAG: MFS transporter [Betaproteobacteria bacterium]|nr:MAG: MFS transporter [Betaproteobacteria bacterium]
MALPSLRALRHRNFRLFLAGQIFALIGYWIQIVAQSWLLYRLTGSATLLGVLAFASSLPILLLAPVAGWWADRCNLHRTMFATQVLELLQAVILATLALTGILQPWHIIALAMMMGILVAIELPIRHAYLLELVDGKEDLPNAIALTSLMANSGRMVGPALAGVLIGVLSEAHCFLINAFTYIAVVISFLLIRVRTQPREPSTQPLLAGLREGFAYAWNLLPIRALLLTLSVVALLAAPYSTLMPVMVREVFHGNADLMGFLMSASGGGAICGTLYLASRKNARGLVRLIIIAVLAAGTALALFAHAPSVWIALPLLSVVGFGILVTSVSVNTILQTIVDDDKRGRVMSLYTAAFLGVMPFGALTAGALADLIGPRATLTLGGLCCVTAALFLARNRHRLREQIRPIYEKLGIARR